MVRLRAFEDRDVLTAALERTEHVYNAFDRVVVSVSGGKDSLAALHLARQVLAGQPVDAVFRDLEFLPDSLLDVVEEVAALPDVRLRWCALPSRGSINVLGHRRDFTHWHPDRRDRWQRPPGPRGDVRPFEVHEHVYTPAERDRLLARGPDPDRPWKGRVAILTGVRAAESLLRYRASVNKLHEPYINASPGGPHVSMVKPLYDWHENDVFRYLHDRRVRWAAEYDARVLAGAGAMRTGASIAVEELRNLRLLREANPSMYDALLAEVPEAAVADRYGQDFNRYGEEAAMTDLDAVEAWVAEHYAGEPASMVAALDRVDFARRLAVSNPRGFPAWYVYREVKRDGHGKGMQPLPRTHPRYGKEPTP